MVDCNECIFSSSCERVWKNTPNVMCVGFDQVKTNADKIRSMTDEELAGFLQNIAMFGGIDGLKKIITWLDWLKQEVTE